jgi:hypothetical protein
LASVGWATYLIYAVFCVITLVWVEFCVPETRGVAVGTAMDDVFGDAESGEETVFEEVEGEETPLLGVLKGEQKRRRSSFASMTYM